jgi:branched-chain amino acid transport system ATP-binding protein
MSSIEITALSSGYNDTPVLKDVNMHATKAAITLVIGPNGSGKSTLLKTIFGLTKILSGRIALDGRDITGMRPHELVRLGLGYVMQRRSIFPHLTVEENLRMGGWAIRNDRELLENRIQQVYMLFPLIQELRNRKAILLSGGQARLLEIARLLVNDPQVLLIDEPSAGLSPKIANSIYKQIGRLRDIGKTVILVEQNVRSAISLADFVCVMRDGKIILEAEREKVEERLKDIISGWLRY